MKRTLKRELKVPEIAERESVATNVLPQASIQRGGGRGCRGVVHGWSLAGCPPRIGTSSTRVFGCRAGQHRFAAAGE